MRRLAVLAAFVLAVPRVAFADDPAPSDPSTADPPAERPTTRLLHAWDSPPAHEHTDENGRKCMCLDECTLCPPTPDDRRGRPLPIIASIVPGILVPGSGSFVAHDKKTAWKLLEMAGIGAGLAVVGGVPLVVSGGNPWASALGAPVLVAGFGIFEQAWLSDFFNAAGIEPGGPHKGPLYSLEAGVLWTHDAYRDRALLHVEGRAVVAPSLMLVADAHRSYDGAYRDGNLQVRTRLLQHFAIDDEYDGSYLEVRTTGHLRDDTDDHVQATTFDAEIAGRVDLHYISNLPDGVFAELSGGYGAERTAYTTAHDWNSLLLARVAWGVYVNHSGEFAVYYDHRRDTIAGGLALSHAAGFVGSFGARLDLRVSGPWALHGELELGNATVSTVGIRYEGGPR